MTEQNTLSISELQQQANNGNLRQKQEDLEAWMFIHKLKQANDGDVQAQIDLACCYSCYLLWRLSEITQMGCEKARALDNLLRGMNKSRARAFEWLNESAKSYCDEAQYLLGHCDLQSYNALQNDALAVEWLKKAAEQNCIEAQYLLSDCYLKSKGVEHNDALAFEWLKKAAEQNYDKAQYGLAYCYLTGGIVEQNEALAFAWFKSAFEQQKQQEPQKQQAEFLYWLACCAFEGNNVEQNETFAFECFKKTAGQGITEVEYRLAYCYFEGKGVEKNYQLGMKWIIRAARKGHVEANNWLTNDYLSLAIPSCLSDKEDAEQYYKFAVDWCLKEVDGQNADGAYLLLGVLYYSGKGVEQSDERASDYLKKGLNAWLDLYHGDDLNLPVIEFIRCYLGNGLAQGKFKGDVIYNSNGYFEVNDYIAINNLVDVQAVMGVAKAGEPISDDEINNLVDVQAVMGGLMSMPSNGTIHGAIKYTDHHKVFLILLSVAIYKKAGEYNLAKEFIIEVFDKDENLDKNFKAICLTGIEQEQEIADKNQALEEKNKELNNLVAMFAHNFLGTLQCIRSNAEHDNNPTIHLKTVKMMGGALTAFSILSADDDKLVDQLKQDNAGETSLQQSLANNLALAISQLLGKTNKDKIVNLYLHHLRKTQQIESDTTSEELRANRDYRKKWQALQHQWEDEFNALFSEKADLPVLQKWIADNFFSVQITGFDSYNISFKEHGITDSIFLIVFMEVFVNAFKYMDVSKNEPLTLRLCEEDRCYKLICENPSSQETGRGTHKGMDFLKTIAKKLGGQFITEMTENSFKSTFAIPSELLK
ncbi:MAG: SEL1-like repeat protein [Methylobacter sp.]|nr:SEL1-like repeat protein [Methylobacter sp.]